MKATTSDIVYLVSECVVGVASVIGNGMVLLTIARFASLQTITNCFIGSLAAADVLVGMATPPLHFLSQLGLPRNLEGCVTVNSLVVLITNISILSLLDVALERFVAISNPFLYHNFMTPRKALVVVAVTWAVAIILGAIPNMGWHLTPENFTTCSFPAVIDRRYMVYLIFFGINVPLLLAMGLIYLYIFYIVYKSRQRTSKMTSHLMTDESRKRQNQDLKRAKWLAYVIILYAVCWIPIYVLNILFLWAPHVYIPIELLLVTIVLSHANSAINPIFYAYSNSKMKSAMKSILPYGWNKVDVVKLGVTEKHSTWTSQALVTNKRTTGSFQTATFSVSGKTNLDSMNTERSRSKSIHSKTVDTEGSQTKSVHSKIVDTEGSQTKSVHSKIVDTEGSQTKSVHGKIVDTEGSQTKSVHSKIVDTEGSQTKSGHSKIVDTE